MTTTPEVLPPAYVAAGLFTTPVLPPVPAETLLFGQMADSGLQGRARPLERRGGPPAHRPLVLG